MKIKRRGAVLSFKDAPDLTDGISSVEFMQMALDLYKKALYMNDVTVVVDGSYQGPVALTVYPMRKEKVRKAIDE